MQTFCSDITTDMVEVIRKQVDDHNRPSATLPGWTMFYKLRLWKRIGTWGLGDTYIIELTYHSGSGDDFYSFQVPILLD